MLSLLPKKELLICLLLYLSFDLSAQNESYQTFTSSDWKLTEISKKIHLIQNHFQDSSLFSSNQHISYVEIHRSWGRPDVDIVAHPEKLIKTSEFSNSSNALVGINGNFFDMKNGGSVSYLVDDGQRLSTNTTDDRAFHQKAAIAMKNDWPKILAWNGEKDWESEIKSKDFFLTGPMLLEDHKLAMLDSVPFNTNRHPRSCVCLKENKNLILLVADGRNKNAQGMSLFELQQVMQWLGCKDAVNLDGGGSSALWIKDKGIVNYPSDNRTWDHKGERPVANVIVVH